MFNIDVLFSVLLKLNLFAVYYSKMVVAGTIDWQNPSQKPRRGLATCFVVSAVVLAIVGFVVLYVPDALDAQKAAMCSMHRIKDTCIYECDCSWCIYQGAAYDIAGEHSAPEASVNEMKGECIPRDRYLSCQETGNRPFNSTTQDCLSKQGTISVREIIIIILLATFFIITACSIVSAIEWRRQ